MMDQNDEHFTVDVPLGASASEVDEAIERSLSARFDDELAEDETFGAPVAPMEDEAVPVDELLGAW